MTSNDQKNIPLKWPEPSQFRRSIRIEFSLYVSAIILTLMLVTGIVITDRYVKTVTRGVVEKYLVQARAYSGPAGKLLISSEEPDALMLTNICQKLANDNSDLFWSGITNVNEVYIAHTEIENVVVARKMLVPKGSRPELDLRSGETVAISGDTIFVLVPIAEREILLGTLNMATSTREIYEARQLSILTVSLITLLMLLIGLPVTFAVLHRKLRPLSIITRKLQQVNFDDISLDTSVVSKNEFGYLAETMRVMGQRLGEAQRDRIEKERISREMDIAREIQASILPREYPSTERFEFAGAYRSAKEVGGDYYDFFEVDEHRLGFLVADVSGKSLPGMLIMLLTRDIVLRLIRNCSGPAELLCGVNRELHENIRKGMFVTMFFCLLDRRNGLCTFASAGHNPLLHMQGKSSSTEIIKTKGFPLGMMPSKQFDERIETGQIRLESGDWLICYTDGINEALNVNQKEYGMERLVKQVQAEGNGSADKLVSETLTHLEQFVGKAPQYDDITLLALKWKLQGVNEPKGELVGASNAR